MRTTRSNIIAILALAALVSVCGVSSAIAGTEVFTRTKPQIYDGTVGGNPARMWFHANAGFGFVETGAVGSGAIEVRVVGGENLLYRVVEGGAAVDQNTVVELIFTLVRVGQDGAPFRARWCSDL